MNLLNTSIEINHMKVKNRLVMPPMAISQADEDGHATSKTFDYYNEKSADGAIGLIIAEHSYVSQEGKAGKGQLSLSDDSDIEGLTKLVSIVHENHTKIMAQISHAGAAAYDAGQPLSASSVPMPSGSLLASRRPSDAMLPKEMTAEDIRRIILRFTDAALRAKAAGFDGVEIHSAHGYLLNQFYSPLTNQRTDSYTGRTISGRVRLHTEIIRSIRLAVGNNYPLALRLGACDYMPGGSTVEDSILAARELEKAGVDLLDISGGLCGYIHPSLRRQGYFDELSEPIKKAVSIPVLLTGGILDRRTAERLLEQKKADLIGVGRPILQDSHWARREICAEA